MVSFLIVTYPKVFEAMSPVHHLYQNKDQRHTKFGFQILCHYTYMAAGNHIIPLSCGCNSVHNQSLHFRYDRANYISVWSITDLLKGPRCIVPDSIMATTTTNI